MLRIYVLCPVRNCPAEVQQRLEEHVAGLEAGGFTVHYPPRDVNQQDDGCGLTIVQAHLAAMKACDEVHIWWDADSKGSHFDLGMAWALEKPLRLITQHAATSRKSYGNVLLKVACPT